MNGKKSLEENKDSRNMNKSQSIQSSLNTIVNIAAHDSQNSTNHLKSEDNK